MVTGLSQYKIFIREGISLTVYCIPYYTHVTCFGRTHTHTCTDNICVIIWVYVHDNNYICTNVYFRKSGIFSYLAVPLYPRNYLSDRVWGEMLMLAALVRNIAKVVIQHCHMHVNVCTYGGMYNNYL